MCIGAHDKHFLLEKELLGNALHPGILVLNNIIQVDLQLYPSIHHCIIKMFFSLKVTIPFCMGKDRMIRTFRS